MFAYAFPPFRFLLQVLLKIKQSDCKIILIAPAWPKQAWFPELLLLSCARPLKLPFRRDLLSQFKGKVVPPRPVSSSSRLATLREGLRQKGFSEGATSHISKSVRQPTGIVYEVKWAIFCDWCSGRDIDPVRVTVQQLADFLVYLFEIKQLVPSTIKGYISVIAVLARLFLYLVDLILGKMNIFLYWLEVLHWKDLNRISWFLSGI